MVKAAKKHFTDNRPEIQEEFERALRGNNLDKIRATMQLVLGIADAERYPSPTAANEIEGRAFARARDVANAIRKRGKPEQAANELATFITIDGGLLRLGGDIPSQVLNDIGFILERGKRWTEAEIVLKEVVARDPKRTIGYKNLADAQEKLGKMDEAAKNREKAKQGGAASAP